MEFTVYGVNASSGFKYYITKEDAFKIYKCMNDAYLTKYIIFAYEYVNNDSLTTYRDSVSQLIEAYEYNGKSYLQVTNSLMDRKNLLMQIIIQYIDGKIADDIESMGIIVDIETINIVFVDSNDSVLEGASETKYSLTLYYRER